VLLLPGWALAAEAGWGGASRALLWAGGISGAPGASTATCPTEGIKVGSAMFTIWRPGMCA